MREKMFNFADQESLIDATYTNGCHSTLFNDVAP